MYNNMFLMCVIFIGMWIYSAVAIAIFVTYLILNKNNNFGDFAPKIEEYSAGGIHYTREVNNVTSHEKTFLFLEYGENPYEGRSHRYPEQLLKKKQDEQNSQGDLDEYNI